MATPQNEDEGILREWAPLNRLLEVLPLTVRKGLFLETVTLTCVDAVPEYIAVGTNIGVVYWYDRESHKLQRLRPEKTSHKITSVKVVSSVDYMVAAGDEGGTVSVFRIPKPTPDWIGPAFKQNNPTNVERYTVGGLHSAPVFTLEWSLNGQKLFSGDGTGLVVLTEIDFYMNLSKAYEIVNEKYRIVQLSFQQSTQVLVVATDYRTIVARRSDSSWLVTQVGQKERRNLSGLGATLFPRPGKPLEKIIYSGRPGLRFWQADIDGTVQKTLIFKDALRKPHPQIELLRLPTVRMAVSWEGDLGPVLVWRGTHLVSFNSSTLVVLDPINITVVASLSGISNLHSVAVTATEIFIISGARNITRIAYLPDAHAEKSEESGSSLFDFKVPPVADSLIDFTSRLKNTATQFVQNPPGSAVSGTLEHQDVSPGTEALDLAMELPPVKPLGEFVQELTVNLDPRIQILDQIGKQAFDDILFSSSRSAKGKSKKAKNIKPMNGAEDLFQMPTYLHPPQRPAGSDGTCGASFPLERSKAALDLRPISHRMESSSDTVSAISEESSDTESLPKFALQKNENNNHLSDSQDKPQMTLDLIASSNHLPAEIPPDILPDLRSPDSILKDVHDKEILVAKAFNLEEVLLSDNNKSKEEEDHKAPTDLVVEQRDDSIGYGPPSGSSSAIPSLDPSNPSHVQDLIQRVKEERGPSPVMLSAVVDTDDTTDGWQQIHTPESAQYISVGQDCVCVIGPGRAIHTSPLPPPTSWHRLPYRASYLATSPDNQLVWKVDFGVAAALTDPEPQGVVGSAWEIASRGVESVALRESCAWYVSAGKVYLQTELSRAKPFREGCLVPCHTPVLKICCSHSMVWVLSAEDAVLWRAGITEDCVEGTHWQAISAPPHVLVADIALGPYDVGWLIDKSNSVHFSDNYDSENCVWWQVLIRDYLFENSSLCQIASNANSVWVTNRNSPYIYVNSSSITGHRWTEVHLSNLTVALRWRQITAEGVFEEKGSLWLLSSANDLFHMRPNSNYVNVVAVPCRAEEVCGVSAAPHALWLLTHAGHIHVRQGMGDHCPEGDRWRTLNLEQISDKQVTLRHVSCGCDIIWACDTNGEMHMAVGSPYVIATDTFSPAWVQVEGKPLPNTQFVKVFVGTETHIVWALDNRSNVYVRSGIFHDFQLGTDWVFVPGVQASQLTISGSLVWALSTSGSVFCRVGISENNYVGSCWQPVPGLLCHLTASVSGGLWGVWDRTGDLVTHSIYELPVSELSRRAAAAAAALDRDDDWEVI